jgi:copper ion binding protein
VIPPVRPGCLFAEHRHTEAVPTTRPDQGPPTTEENDMSETTSAYQVTGMTCGHCVQAITTEIGALPGVEEVRVDLSSGSVVVASLQPLAESDVAAAVHEAGYQLA